MSEQEVVFNFEKIYVKDLSLEVPHAPGIFFQTINPSVDVEFRTENSSGAEGFYECALTVTVTAREEEKVCFLVEVTQCGLFQIRNVPEADLPMVLGITCPTILFPYVREAVSTTVTRAGFAPVLLNHINFEALYQQQQATAQA